MVISPFSSTAADRLILAITARLLHYVRGICGHDGKAQRESRPHNRLLAWWNCNIYQLTNAILRSFAGASSGIGAATAILFSSLGADLALR